MSTKPPPYSDYLVKVQAYPEYDSQRASQGLPRRWTITVTYTENANQELDNAEIRCDDFRDAWRMYMAMVRAARLTRLIATDFME